MASENKFYYGWVIAAVASLMITVTYGLVYSYSVFFKPLGDYFGWDRATVSLIYSFSIVVRAVVSIGIGWLADRYGAKKLMLFCGFIMGLGFILSSRAHTLGQFFWTYAVVESIGLSGAFAIGTSEVSRWFTKNRGWPLGIAAMGSGLGTTFIVPLNEQLVSAFGWSQAFIICGGVAGVIMIILALFLRPVPASSLKVEKTVTELAANKKPTGQQSGASLGQALRDPRMILFMASLFLFFFGVQMIIVHLVNYATDMGMTPLAAATLISIIGAVSIVGRLLTGIASDKIGLQNSLLLTCIILVVSFLCIIFLKSIWSLYLFAVVFGLCYGGEVPLMPLFVSKYLGTRSMGGLMGLASVANNAGGAIGPFIAGMIFDDTKSYEAAFICGAITALACVVLVLILRSINAKRSEDAPYGSI